MDEWNNVMMAEAVRESMNQEYMKRIVWQNARDLYVLTRHLFMVFPFNLKKPASQQIASNESIQRNIAEGYCRRTINEYPQQ